MECLVQLLATLIPSFEVIVDDIRSKLSKDLVMDVIVNAALFR